MEELLSGTKQKMDKAIESMKHDFVAVRTGRANPGMVEGIKIDYYGTPTPLSQVGNITVPDPQMIMIAPWDKGLIGEITKAIQRADIGITPQSDGNIVRLPIPPLNEERRKELVKQIKKIGEECKIAVRNVRRDGNEKLKKMEKDKLVSQDDEKTLLEQIQKDTDEHIKMIDTLLAAKEKELMEV